MDHAVFLTVLTHGAVGAWDEIIPITLAVLTTVVGVVIFLLARRYKPEEEENVTADDAGQ